MRSTPPWASVALIVCYFSIASASAGTVYSNDFQTPATAFNSLAASGTLTSLTTTSLPADSGGISSTNQSTWLGPLGLNVAKSTATPEIVTLSLSGLVPNTSYNVSFDLLIGGSWDGSAGGFGPDEWKLTAVSGPNNTPLVDATFSNCGVTNQLCGANSPQSYSDATPLGGLGSTTFAPETGADFFSDSNSDYSQDYGIYYFGHGSGNPVLTFTAGASTATLTFQRVSGSTDSADEYWALDNVSVSGAIQSSICSATNPAPISGSTGAQGVLDPTNTDSNQGLVWPAGSVSAGISMDTGQVVFQNASLTTVGTAALPGAGGNGLLNFLAVHLPAGFGVNFSTALSGLQPPIGILSCQDVVLDAGSTLTVSASSSKGPVPAGFAGASGTTVPNFNPAGFGPRTGSLPAGGSLYPAIGGGGGNGDGGVTGGGGGPAFVISAAQRVTVNGTIAAGGLSAPAGASLAQGGGGGSVRLAGLLVEGVGTINTNGGADANSAINSPAGPIEVQAFLQDLFTGTTTTTPIRGNLPVQPIPANLPTITITQLSTTNPVFNANGFPNTGSLTTPDVTLLAPSTPQVNVSFWVPTTSVPDGTILNVRAVGTDGSVFTATPTVSNNDALTSVTLNAGVTYQIVATPGTTFSLARPNPRTAESAKAREHAGDSLLAAGSAREYPNRDGAKTSAHESSVVEQSLVEEWMKAFGLNPELAVNTVAKASGTELREDLR